MNQVRTPLIHGHHGSAASEVSAVPMHLVYVSPKFPDVRHGFEAYELQTLRHIANIHVISLRKPSREEILWLARGFPELQGLPLVPFTVIEIIRGAIWAATRRPKALARLFLEFLRLMRFDARGGAKALLGGCLGCAIARRCTRLGAEWIHADFASAPATAALVASRLTGLPWSFMGHARDVFSTQPAGRATRPFIALKMRHAAVVFAENSVCQRTLDGIADEFGVSRHSRLRRNGIVIRNSKLGEQATTAFTIVGLGALIPKKGFDTLVEAVAAARRHIPTIELEIHGDGPERSRLERLASERGVKLRLGGAFSNDELVEILRRASLVALPSRQLADGDSDGVPTVLIEALAQQRPVVATTVGSIADLVHNGETGLLVPPNDPAALANALIWSARHPHESVRMARLGSELVAREFTAEASCAVFLSEVRGKATHDR